MGFKHNILLAASLALSVLAAPTPDCPYEDTAPKSKTLVTEANLIAIDPKTASCSGASFPQECADAKTAAAALNSSFEKYNITSTGEVAALIAYTLFESGSFKYKQNHFPGRPGQGTRMMAMPDYVKSYATSIDGADAVSKAGSAGGDAGLVAILALANADDAKSFGSAAWFLTQCKPEIRAGLVAETVDGWHKFLTDCVGTTAAAERDEPWTATKQVLLKRA